MKYILAKHTGKGFYTHKDRQDMPVFKNFGDLYIVDGNCDKWIAKAKGMEINKKKAIKIFVKKYKEGLINEIAELKKELTEKENVLQQSNFEKYFAI